MKSNKIKALLKIKEISNMECFKFLKLASQQSLSNKFKNEAFSADDLIKLAELTDTTLAFIDNKTNNILIKFDKSDLKDNK